MKFLGSEGCTPVTLTRISDVAPLSFKAPKFTFSYDYCCDFDGNIDFCDGEKPTRADTNGTACSDLRNWSVDSGMIFSVSDIPNKNNIFKRLLKALSIGIILVPLIAYLESISIAKGFAKKNKYRVDSNQELIALGASNFITAFTSGFPSTGSFSRSAVNFQAGAATTFSGTVVGTIVILD